MITPKTAFQKLYDLAILRTIIGSPDGPRLKRCLRDGEPIPDVCKPGALLNMISKEEREALQKLKPGDINWRLDAIFGPLS